MKATIRIALSLIIFLSGFVFQSCQEDESLTNHNAPSSVKFAFATLGISELAGPTEILLSLGKPAPKDGVITLDIGNGQAEYIITYPEVVDGKIALPVAKGQSSVKFKLTPVDDNLHNGNRMVEFTISTVSEGFIITAEKVMTITIFENDLPNLVNFMETQGSMKESSEGYMVSISMTHQALGAGTVEVSLLNAGELYGSYFVTEPEALNGVITMPVTIGSTTLPIKFIPINNSKVNGHNEIQVRIASAFGSVTIGNQVNFKLSLLDDELQGLPKSYEIIAGDKVKKVFEYNENGKVAKVYWETYTPFLRSGTDKYFYNEVGQLIRINKYENGEYAIDVHYIWENGRIVKSEEVQNGIKTKYNEYFYDDFGNVDATAYYNRQSNGTYKLWLVIDYLYFIDGNLYKSISSTPTEGGEFITLSTKTYDGYVNGVNPFPMVEILPGMSTMHKLPTYHKVKENGFTFVYYITYTLREDGLPVNRSVSGSGGSQTTKYEYY